MMIPAPTSLEDFEKQAIQQQKALKEDDYVDVEVEELEDDTLC